MSLHYEISSLPSSASLSVMKCLNHHHKTSPQQNTLNFILEIFQCNISQEQAWALIYQSTKTLNELITEYERNEKVSELLIRKLTSFSNIILEINGNISVSTWTTGTKENTFQMSKSDDKRLTNESINTLIASLATIIYSALEWNWKRDEQLIKCDDDEELDLEESLELLMFSMLRGSENKDLVDEGYIDALEESCINSVLTKCQAHYNELISAEKKNNTILEMLSTKLNTNNIGPDYYYRTVCKMMMDEALKLSKLVNQFCDNQNYDQKLTMLHSRSYQSLVDTENLKVWAQTWIKVMSELRFGVRLRPISTKDNNLGMNIKQETPSPMDELMKEIKTKREILRKTSNDFQSMRPISLPVQHHSSLPIISQETIIKCLKNLKPASKRKLLPPISPEPCLHDRLMSAIRSRDYILRPATTIVKPSIEKLYLSEKQRLKEYRSLYDCYSRKILIPPSKRKINSDETFDYYQQVRSLYSSTDSEISLNKLKESNESLKKRNYKKKKISIRDYQSNGQLTSTPKVDSILISDSLSTKNITIEMEDTHISLINSSPNKQTCRSYEGSLVNKSQSFHDFSPSNAYSLRWLNTVFCDSYLRRSFIKRSTESNPHPRKHSNSFCMSTKKIDNNETIFQQNQSPYLMTLIKKSFRSSFMSRLFGSKSDSKLKKE